jgi:hypothetical protein
MLVLVGLVRAFWRGIGDLGKLDQGVFVLETGLVTGPFMPLAFTIEAVGIESIAIGADRTPIIIVAAGGSLALVVVGYSFFFGSTHQCNAPSSSTKRATNAVSCSPQKTNS